MIMNFFEKHKLFNLNQKRAWLPISSSFELEHPVTRGFMSTFANSALSDRFVYLFWECTNL